MNQTFQTIIKEVAAGFVERNEEVQALMTCILSEQHGVMLGSPGIAKSALINAIVERFPGTLVWHKLLRRDSTSDEVFGPVSMKGLENDEYRRNVDKFLPAAHIGIPEEIFKANSTTLNGFLDIINERTFDNGSAGQIKCPLMSIIGASNEEPESENLSALWDRLLVRLVVRDIQEDSAFNDFLSGIDSPKAPASLTFSTLEDLKKAQDDVKKVALGNEARAALVTLRKRLHDIGLRPSPRRFKACVYYMRAVAWLEGRNKIEADDLMSLVHCLWNKQDQITDIAKILGEIASPDLGKIIELLDACKQAYDNGRNSTDASVQIESNTKLRRGFVDVDKIGKGATGPKVKAKAEEACQSIKGWQNRLLEKLGMSSL